MPTPYRILSLDGGGSWAIIQVKCLQRLFSLEATGHEVLRHFELVAASSGGSIVLAALVANLKLSEILLLFQDQAKRQQLYPPSQHVGWQVEHGLSQLTAGGVPALGPHYSTPQKLRALETLLAPIRDLCLAQVPAYVAGAGARQPQVLITAFDYTRQRSRFFRSDVDSYGDSANLEGRLCETPPPQLPGKTMRLLEAVHASSTAPIEFFDATAEVTINGQLNYLWDGGVGGYNNPTLAALTEALVNGIEAAQIRVLSLGAGTTVFPVLAPGQRSEVDCLVTSPAPSAGFLVDVHKFTSAVVAPPDAASFVAFTTLNPGFVRPDFTNRNFIRASPSVQPRLVGDEWQAPVGFDVATIDAIKLLAMDASSEEDVQLILKICEAWLANHLPNQPIRASTALKCLVGQDTFAEVESLFHQLFPPAGT